MQARNRLLNCATLDRHAVSHGKPARPHSTHEFLAEAGVREPIDRLSDFSLAAAKFVTESGGLRTSAGALDCFLRGSEDGCLHRRRLGRRQVSVHRKRDAHRRHLSRLVDGNFHYHVIMTRFSPEFSSLAVGRPPPPLPKSGRVGAGCQAGGEDDPTVCRRVDWLPPQTKPFQANNVSDSATYIVMTRSRPGPRGRNCRTRSSRFGTRERTSPSICAASQPFGISASRR